MDFYETRKLRTHLKKFILFFKLKIFRQTFIGNVMLIFTF